MSLRTSRCRLAVALLLCSVLSGSLVACSSKAEQQPDTNTQSGPSLSSTHDSLRRSIDAYLKTQSADVGVAVMAIEDGDTLSVNGDKMYSLMSVTKFPQALLLLHLVDQGRIDISKPLTFTPEHLSQRTASTLVKDHPQKTFALSIPEVLRYAVGQSDNISSNVMFDAEGGPDSVTAYLRSIGVDGISIGATYREFPRFITANMGTPNALVSLLKKFHSDKLLSDSSHALLWRTMSESLPGADRIKGQLPPGTVVAHKTGSSGTDSNGVYIALNDVGIVKLPNGKHLAIAVLTGNSKSTDAELAKIIATVSKMAWDEFVK